MFGTPNTSSFIILVEYDNVTLLRYNSGFRRFEVAFMPKGQVAYMIFQNEGKAFIRNVANNSPNVTYRTVHSLKFRTCFSCFAALKVPDVLFQYLYLL
jgi:hypothetical protein